MLNLINPLARRITVKVDADVAAGTLCRRTGVVGLPISHALNGATVTFIEEGLVNLTFTGQGTVAAGCYLYFNRTATPTANALSLGAAAGDIPVAQVIGAAVVSTLYPCRLMIGLPRAAAGNAQ